MPKKKKFAKKLPTRRSAPVSRQLRDSLAEADELIERRRFGAARTLLDKLLKDHPDNVAGLRLLASAAAELNDVHTYLFACERLFHFCPRDPDLPYMLAAAYLQNGWPALTLDMARHALAANPAHSRAATTRQMLERLEPLVMEDAARLGFDGPDGLELTVMHARVQALIAQGRYARARELAQRLITRRPRFTPAYNNASIACCNDGAVALAIDLAQRLLAFEPDNFFALANLTQYHCTLGNMDDARACARRLKAIAPTSQDQACKLAQALAMLRDDAGVLSAVEKGLLVTGRDDAMLHHLAAVACLRLGQEQAARQHWDAALQIVPDLELACDNLDDLEQPAAKRNGPWSFSLRDLVPKKLLEELIAQPGLARGNVTDEPVRQQTRWFLERHPELEGLLTLLLDQGDPPGRDFALLLAQLFRTPAMLHAVREFAVGQNGADDLRVKAAHLAQQAGMFPDGLPALWLGGAHRENLLQNIEVCGTPTERTHAPSVFEMIQEGAYAIQNGDPASAERVLRRALAIDPDDPMVMNNLAAACAALGRTDESEALSIRLHERHTDYLFGRTALASLAAQLDDTRRARELLEPLLQRKKMHVSEMSALCIAQVNLLIHEGKRDQAVSWITAWRLVAPDHPAIPGFATQLGEG